MHESQIDWQTDRFSPKLNKTTFIGIAQGYMLFWTNPGSSTPQSISCTAICTPHHTNHPSKVNKTCLRKEDKIMSDILQWALTHGHTRLAKTYINQFCVGTGCHLDDLPNMMVDCDGWPEKFKEICSVGMPWWWWLMKLNLPICHHVDQQTLNYISTKNNAIIVIKGLEVYC